MDQIIGGTHVVAPCPNVLNVISIVPSGLMNPLAMSSASVTADPMFVSRTPKKTHERVNIWSSEYQLLTSWVKAERQSALRSQAFRQSGSERGISIFAKPIRFGPVVFLGILGEVGVLPTETIDAACTIRSNGHDARRVAR